MTRIKRNDQLAFDASLLSRDHRQFVARVKAVCRAMERRVELGAIGRAFANLYDNTVEHFAREEALMCEYGYPGFPAHASEHEALVAQLKRLRDGVTRGALEMNDDSILFLRKWALNHITEADRAFVEFVKARTQGTP